MRMRSDSDDALPLAAYGSDHEPAEQSMPGTEQFTALGIVQLPRTFDLRRSKEATGRPERGDG